MKEELTIKDQVVLSGKLNPLNRMSLTNDDNNTRTKIIEFIGPPGVGKSTVYKSLCKKWNTQSNWICQDQILPIEKPPISETRFWLEYQLRKLIKKIGNNNIHEDFGLQFVADNKVLAHFLWDHLAHSNAYDKEEVDKKFRSAYYLFRDFCRYQAIWDSKSSKPCIIDEGLFVKSFFILHDEQAIADIMEQYIPLRPLPHAVVYINTTQTDIIVDRLLSRKKVIASHKGKERDELQRDIQKWQFLFSIVTEKMERCKIPVYYIDGLKPVKENVILLDSILDKCLLDKIPIQAS